MPTCRRHGVRSAVPLSACYIDMHHKQDKVNYEVLLIADRTEMGRSRSYPTMSAQTQRPAATGLGRYGVCGPAKLMEGKSSAFTSQRCPLSLVLLSSNQLLELRAYTTTRQAGSYRWLYGLFCHSRRSRMSHSITGKRCCQVV